MNPGDGKQLERFVEYAALARAKPTFDAEERDWTLATADRLRETFQAACDPDQWRAHLDAASRQGGVFRLASSQKHGELFNAWVAADPESSRSALAAFADPAPDPEYRFNSFAQALEEAVKAGVTFDTNATLALGSICNFAVDPQSLPMIRSGQFGKLERILGYQLSGSAPATELYAEHLAFARWIRSRMEESGLPIRDMIDVQSLITIGVREADFWVGDRLYAIGAAHRIRQAQAGVSDAGRYLSVCAVYRDEGPYLQEWVEFHRLVGVEHFFLYDNLSTDAHLETLAPYVEDGIVTLHDWKVPKINQRDTYDHCLAEHGRDSRWIAFLDIDEFLFSPTGLPLPQLLVDYEQWPAVGVNWAIFGRSGHVTKPPGLVIENYDMRVDAPTSSYIKSIVDPRRVSRCASPHHFVYDSLLAVDENHYPIHDIRSKSVSISRLRVNHYLTKSEEEARAKLTRPKRWHHSRHWRSTRLEDNFPQELDRTIMSYVSPLRAALVERTGLAAIPSQPARPPVAPQGP